MFKDKRPCGRGPTLSITRQTRSHRWSYSDLEARGSIYHVEREPVNASAGTEFGGTADFELGDRCWLPLLLADHLGRPSVDLSSTTSGGRAV